MISFLVEKFGNCYQMLLIFNLANSKRLLAVGISENNTVKDCPNNEQLAKKIIRKAGEHYCDQL